MKRHTQRALAGLHHLAEILIHLEATQTSAHELKDSKESKARPRICAPQAIQQEGLPSTESDVGRISARLRDKGKDYGDFWGARATGSSDRYDEFTWFIR